MVNSWSPATGRRTEDAAGEQHRRAVRHFRGARNATPLESPFSAKQVCPTHHHSLLLLPSQTFQASSQALHLPRPDRPSACVGFRSQPSDSPPRKMLPPVTPPWRDEKGVAPRGAFKERRRRSRPGRGTYRASLFLCNPLHLLRCAAQAHRRLPSPHLTSPHLQAVPKAVEETLTQEDAALPSRPPPPAK